MATGKMPADISAACPHSRAKSHARARARHPPRAPTCARARYPRACVARGRARAREKDAGVTPKFLINPNRQSTLLTVVKSRSTWVLTSKNSPANLNDTMDQVDTHVGSTHGQSLGQTPPKP
jgi:hypothetical protein